MPRTATPRTVRVAGVTYSSPDEARVAADELEHNAESIASNLRRSGKEGEADTVSDRARANAERLRGWARDVEAGEAAATEQPPGRPSGRPAGASRRRTGSSSGRRRPSTKGGVGEAAVAGNLAGVARDVASDARAVPIAGDAAVGFADLAWTGVGAIVALALAYALFNEKGHGPAAVSGLAGATNRAFSRFLSPTDPFILGNKATDSLANTPQPPTGIVASPTVTGPPGAPAPLPGVSGGVRPTPASGPNTWKGAGGGTMSLLRRLVAAFHLSVTNVYTPGVDSAGGYHPLHRAIDVAPDARFKQFAGTFALHRPTLFRELWGPGLGFYIKDGRIHAGDFPDAGTGPHGHIAI